MAAPRDEKADAATKARYEAIRERYRPAGQPVSQQREAQQRPQSQQWQPEEAFGAEADAGSGLEPGAELTTWRAQILEQLRADGRQVDAELEHLFVSALRHAGPAPGSGEFVVSLRAVTTALTFALDGVRGRSLEVQEAAEAWAQLQAWLERHLPPQKPPSPPELDRLWSSAGGMKAVLSVSTRSRLLPALDKMAGDTPLGVRHLVRAVGSGLVSQGKLDEAGWPAGPGPTLELADLLDRLAAIGTPARRATEDTPVLEDKPATVDHLGRKPVASVLAQRLRAIWPSLQKDDQALIVHLHGPWGSGKSSILNLLRAELTTGPAPWLVVEFNAWRHARVQPPWWSLVRQTRRAVRALGPLHFLKVEALWLWWRIKMDWLVALGALLLIAVLAGAAAMGLFPSTSLFGKDGPVGALAGIAGLVTALLLLNRQLVLGSKGASDALDALRADAAQPVADLFYRLVDIAGRPTIFYLDDLDRCAPPQVTDLLEGVQTLFRETACVFVAVGDRAWLCEAFELKYAAYARVIGEPGRPLGYLFLDKLFQISVGVPAFTPAVRKAYLALLLGRKAGAPALPDSEARARIEAADGHEAIAKAIEAADLPEQAALRAAAAEREGSAKVQADIEHRLEPLAELMEANPRAMKQVVNALGLNRARMWLEGRNVPFEVLARFTILELRWPAAAAYLVADPARVDAPDSWPEALAPLSSDPAFKAVLGDETSAARLDAAAIAALRGQTPG